MSYILGKIINSSLGGMSGHATPSDIKRLPLVLPRNPHSIQYQSLKSKIIQNVDQILKKLSHDLEADVNFEERKINDYVRELYQLKTQDISRINQYLNKMRNQKEKY
jgi:ABC-type phosphate transport system auxiliary subunit